MIEADAISKSYGSLRAVHGVSFSVLPGDVLGLLGPNGAGKTTILRMLAGILVPSSGAVRIDGYDVTDDRIGAQARIGYLPENAPLYPSFTTLEHLRFSARVHGLSVRSAYQAIERVSVLCGVDGVMDRLIGQLSRGYRQRVGLAAALVHDPSVLILDEPTNGLDPNQIQEFRSIIRAQGEATSVLLSTHILQEVEAVCDEILVINRGVRVAYGSPLQIRSSLAGSAVARLTTVELPRKEALAALEALGSTSIDRGAEGEYVVRVRLGPNHSSEDVYAWSVEFGIPLRSLEHETETLQSLFAKLTLPEQRGGMNE